MRRCFALLALVVTTWSSAAVSRCAPAIFQPIGAEAVGEQHGHSRHVAHRSGDAQHGTPDSDGPASHSAGQECGVIMACGTALGGHAAEADGGLPASDDGVQPTAVITPSPAEVTQDPPPPRRLA